MTMNSLALTCCVHCGDIIEYWSIILKVILEECFVTIDWCELADEIIKE